MGKVSFTAGRVSGFKCPPDKKQAFLWDATTVGLGLRATPNGKPAYVFQSVFDGKDIRITIGSPNAWGIKEAQEKARALQRLIDEGVDPRSIKAEKLAAAKATKQLQQEAEKAAQAAAVTVGSVWPLYLEQGRPKRKEAWKPRYLADLKAMVGAGGEKKKRGQGVTRPGPLYPLLALPLAQVNEDTLKEWFDREALSGRHQAARALMMFRGFLRWCASKPEYRDITDREAGRAPAILDELPSNATSKRTDALEAAQVSGWWRECEELGNPVASAYLRALLLTGARREEMAALTWAGVDFRWRKLTIADKVDVTRTIPLTPYLAQMLSQLPKKGVHVFATTSKKTGRITDARASHLKVLQGAGIAHLTVHGLRRSFSLLAEAAGAPAGAIAQIMGHKPSATAEGYRPRSMDALRPFAERIEAWILEQAGVQFDAKGDPGKLRVAA
jgi:integrase